MKLFAVTLAVLASACAIGALPYGPAVSSQYISHGGHGGWAHAGAPVHIHNGVPIDTPEVQHARAVHLAAHAAASHGHYAPAQAYHAVPQIHNGVPVDTPEVQHAKAVHFAAVAEAQSRDVHGHDGHYAPAHYASAHSGAYHIPVIHNGVPVDTPEVQHARAAHFAAVAEASAHSGYGAHSGYHGDDGHWDGNDGNVHHQQW